LTRAVWRKKLAVYSFTLDHKSNLDWYRQIAAGWARRMINGISPAAWADDTETEIHFAITHLQLDPTDRLLDIGCGWGRHSLPLAAYGLCVTGVDLSHELLTLARYHARRRGLTVTWVEADVANMPLRGTFDAIVQFCGNFMTWFTDRERALEALWTVATLLRPGGRMLLGTNDWELELPYRSQQWDEWPGGAAIYRQRYDAQQRIAESQTVIFGPQHQRLEYRRQTWWPSHEDMEILFAQVGLRIRGRYNAYVDAPYNPDQGGLIYLLAREDR
jgi:2-polyprenyl-3-methyl-5-hydroxy-6-metoxy-1,4-benzoquinol methylase